MRVCTLYKDHLPQINSTCKDLARISICSLHIYKTVNLQFCMTWQNVKHGGKAYVCKVDNQIGAVHWSCFLKIFDLLHVRGKNVFVMFAVMKDREIQISGKRFALDVCFNPASAVFIRKHTSFIEWHSSYYHKI